MALMTVALGAAVAGYYFYASKNAQKHRKIAAKWAVAFKSDVLKAARKAQHLDRKTLQGIVSSVAKSYHNMKDVNRKELERAARELRSNWQSVAKEVGKGVSATKKTVKKTAKKVAKSVGA